MPLPLCSSCSWRARLGGPAAACPPQATDEHHVFRIFHIWQVEPTLSFSSSRTTSSANWQIRLALSVGEGLRGVGRGGRPVSHAMVRVGIGEEGSWAAAWQAASPCTSALVRQRQRRWQRAAAGGGQLLGVPAETVRGLMSRTANEPRMQPSLDTCGAQVSKEKVATVQSLPCTGQLQGESHSGDVTGAGCWPHQRRAAVEPNEGRGGHLPGRRGGRKRDPCVRAGVRGRPPARAQLTGSGLGRCWQALQHDKQRRMCRSQTGCSGKLRKFGCFHHHKETSNTFHTHKLVVLEARVGQGVWHHHHRGARQLQRSVAERVQAHACGRQARQKNWGLV